MQSHSNGTYQIGIICALPKELKAVRAMFDEEHAPLKSKDAQDHNSYILGRVGEHNVVAAGLPTGVYGTTSATSVGKDMLRTFPHLRFGLLVGIGGGVPDIKANHDIRLGDVVVGAPHGQHGGVVQYDSGKLLRDGTFERKGSLNKPPQALLTALTALQASFDDDDSIAEYLDEVDRKHLFLRDKGYSHPGSDQDRLHCPECGPSPWWWFIWVVFTWLCPLWRCDECDNGQVKRHLRSHTMPVVHYGTIASANTLLKDARKRDRLKTELGARCVEMEAAGLMDNFPCLVVRGICDYADAYKNDMWQEWAALTAAAFTKGLLKHVSPQATKDEKSVIEMVDQLHQHSRRQEVAKHDERYRECHRAFDVARYEDQKQRNRIAVDGTCLWVLQNEQYERWSASTQDDLLWISADPGCGKSVLSRMLVDKCLPAASCMPTIICYFFFKDNEEQDSLATALCAVLHQIFDQQPELIRHALPVFDKKKTDRLEQDARALWRILLSISSDANAIPIICVLDALDECRDGDRQLLVNLLCEFYQRCSSRSSEQQSWLKCLVTSRPQNDIQVHFDQLSANLPAIHLRGEDQNDQVRDEINLVIDQRMVELGRQLRLTDKKQTEITDQLQRMENRTYLWLHLVMDEVGHALRRSARPNQVSIPSLPATVTAAYEGLLKRIDNIEERTYAKTVLTIIVGARRPLTVAEMALAFDVATLSETPRSLADLTVDVVGLGDKIRQWCGLFVFVNHSRLYLLHQTAKEFLLSHDSKPPLHGWQHCLQPLDVEREMARICILFLCLSEFNTGDPDSELTKDGETSDEDTVYSFFVFAAEHWAGHTRSVERSLNEQLQAKIRSLYDIKSTCFKRWTTSMWQRLYRNYSPTMSGIQLASHNGHIFAVQYLLSVKPNDIDDCSNHYETALHLASEEGHVEVVRALLDAGADVNTQNGRYGGALHAASAGGHTAVVRALLDADADVNAQSFGYGSALSAAAVGGHTRILRTLLAAGADDNAPGGFHTNALREASARGHVEMVQALLNARADVQVQGRSYLNGALEVASYFRHLEVVQLLYAHGATDMQDHARRFLQDLESDGDR